MRLGTKLTICLSLIIIIVLSGYGYSTILSRREILIRKMQMEAKSIGKTLKVSLERAFIEDMEHIQRLIDAVEEYERTLGIIVHLSKKELVFSSKSLKDESIDNLQIIKESIFQRQTEKGYGFYKEIPVFLYTFPVINEEEEVIGEITIFQNATFLIEDIRQSEWSIFLTTLLLISFMVGVVLFLTQKWVAHPLSQLSEGIETISKGNLDKEIYFQSGSEEISKVAQTFNQMVVNLKKARENLLKEAEARVALERELRQSEKFAIVGKMASELAHEIRTPLTSIKIFIQSIEKEVEMDESQREDFLIIQREIDRIDHYITRLLNFSRPEEPQFQILDINVLLKETVFLMIPKINQNHIDLDICLTEPSQPIIGDPKQLSQIFINLLINGVEAMAQGGKLIVRSYMKDSGEKTGGMFWIEIQDTGEGIPEKHLPHIFDPFFTTKKSGTGLGLAIVYSLVKNHQGEIEVKSEPGKGSTFIVKLPIQRESL